MVKSDFWAALQKPKNGSGEKQDHASMCRFDVHSEFPPDEDHRHQTGITYRSRPVAFEGEGGGGGFCKQCIILYSKQCRRILS